MSTKPAVQKTARDAFEKAYPFAKRAPEYTLQLRNWNMAPQIDAARFTFVPPPAAKQLDPASVTVNTIGDLTLKAQ